jgi:hypothetical protein
VKKYALCVVLFLVLPASATISYVRSNAQWSGGTTSCVVGLTTTASGDMFAVWGEWQTAGGFPNTITITSATDSSGKALLSAVGPTVQSTANMAAQIFYLASIPAGGDAVTLNFSGAVNASACVVAEYTGADPSYPLDSVSAGYSYSGSPGTALDSGSAAPANPGLVVFGAGIVDTSGTPSTALPFMIEQSTTTGVCAFVENNGSPTPEILQHAYANCTNSGDWLMQMAVFRAPSWTVAGGWSPTRPPDVTNATQYPGVDICAQAQNAAVANPNATILMPISGTMACSVDPTGAASTSPITSAPAFQGKLKLVAVGGSVAQLNMDTPWVFFNGSMTLDGGSVQFAITQKFRNNWSGQRCWTESATSTLDFGECANALGSGFKIANNSPLGSGCALVTYPGSTGPYEIRGGEIVSLTGLSDPRNNGVFRVIPNGASQPCGAPGGPTATQFYIWAPSAQNCTGSSGCGSSATLAAQTAMFYMGPRAFDDPQNLGGANSCILVNGGDRYGGGGENCNVFGIKLLNLGELDGSGYGVEGIDNSQCMEQCAINSFGSRTIYRTSLLSYGQWSTVSQNNAAIQHFEDYCNYGCVSSGSYLYGAFHVGIWLRDTWNHGSVQDATINELAYAGIMLDGMTGYSSGVSIKGIHFQNGGDAPPPNGGNWGGSLANIAIGAQASASSVYVEQIQGNLDAGVAANILISGSNAPPLNLPAWQASSNSGSCSGPPSVCFTYPVYAAIFPTTGNTGCGGSGCVFEVSAPGGSGTSHPSWPTTPGACTTPEAGTPPGLTWCNVGGSLPNSTGPGGNVVKAVEITNNNGDTPTIFNSGTDNKWTDASIAEYTYQNNSGSTYECSSSLQHPCHQDQGLLAGTVDVQANSFVTEIANNASVGTATNEWAKLTGAPSTATVAGTTADPVVGICVAGCGTTGNAQIAYGGRATCIFDNATTAGDYFVLSTVGGCHDTGTSAPGAFGRVLVTSATAGTDPVFIALHFQ